MCKTDFQLAIYTIDLIIRKNGRLIPVEIKSAGTFLTDFLKQFERLRALKRQRVAPGAVLYNNEKRFRLQGIRIFNPLAVEDIWATLNAPVD